MEANRAQVRAWVESMDAQGYTSDEIRQQLALAGWGQADIEALMGGAAIPPPALAPPRTGETPVPPGTPPVAQAPPLPQPVALPPTPGYAQAPYLPPQQVATQTNGLALAALILGIATLFFGPLTAIAGLIVGIMAMKRGGPGRPMAVAGVVISAVLLFFWLIFIGIWIAIMVAAAKAPSHSGSSSAIESSSNSIRNDSTKPDADEVKPEESGKPLITPNSLGGGSGKSDDQAVCLTRIQALASGMLMYAADHDTALPDATGWPLGIQSYVQDDKSFLCPADDRVAPQDPGGRPTSFTMYDPMGGTYLNSLKEKDKAYLLFDGTEVNGEEVAAAFRHNGGLNLAYIDGHAQGVGKARFEKPD